MRKIFSSSSSGIFKFSRLDYRVYFCFCSPKSKIDNYDLITIGPYANGVAKLVNYRSRIPVSMLTVQTENYVVQPSLMMNCIKDKGQQKKQNKMHVKLNQNNQKFSTIQRGVSLKKIQPQKSQITLTNGKTYRYGYLVCQSLPHQQPTSTDIGTGISQQNQPQNSNILTDSPYNAIKIHEMFQQKQGKFVFTVPKHHLGYQNYFMMALKDKIQMNRNGNRGNGYQFGNVQISVVCEGNGLFEGSLGQAVQEMMVKKGIKFYKNMKYEIDGKTNRIVMSPLTATANKTQNEKVNSNASATQSVYLPFTYVFSYTPFSSKLKLAQPVDPLMLHSIPYPNIYILGPSLQNRIHSFSAIMKMTNSVARSLVYDIIGVRRRTIYDGQWKLRLWTSYNQLVQIHGNQRDNKWKMTGQTFGAFRSFFKSSLYPALVNSMINESPFTLGSYQKVEFQPPRKYSQSYKNKNQQENKAKKVEKVKKP